MVSYGVWSVKSDCVLIDTLLLSTAAWIVCVLQCLCDGGELSMASSLSGEGGGSVGKAQ